MPAPQNILLMGSPVFAIPTLQAIDAAFPGAVQAVFSQPDKPKGRGKHVEPTPVKAWALSRGLAVFTPSDKLSLQKEVEKLNPDLIVVIAYGMILPKTVTDRFFCLNSHGSILPDYRGASPIQAALLHGDTQTGISLIHMNEKMDEGPVVMIKTIPILPEDTLGTLTPKLAQLSAEACLDFICNHLSTNQVQKTTQDSEKASYCHKLSSADRELINTESPQKKWQKIKAFSPSPGAFMMQGEKRIKILEAKLENDTLVPLKVQPEGKQPMRYHDFCLGNPQGLIL